MALKLIRKLSTRTVVGKVKVEPGQRTLLYQVAGIARGMRQGESNFGPYVAFSGDFAAIVAKDGNLTGDGYRAPAAFFPEPFSGMLASAISDIEEFNAKGKAEAAANKTAFMAHPVAVEFKVNIIAVHDEKSNVGYTYEVEPVVQLRESDQLAALIASTGQKQLTGSETVDTATGEVHKTGDKSHGGKKGEPAHSGKRK